MCVALFVWTLAGPSLFDKVVENKYLPEDQVKEVTYQLVSAIQHMHVRGAVHRDLKPENLVFFNTDPHSEVCLIDFGFAKYLDPKDAATHQNLMRTMCGTPEYEAPEVASGKPYNGQLCDVWSIGVLIYVMYAVVSMFVCVCVYACAFV